MDSGNRTWPIAHGGASIVITYFASMSPTQLAASFAAFLNFLLIIDWFWKRFWRPLAIRRGWIKLRKREEEFMAPTDKGDL